MTNYTTKTTNCYINGWNATTQIELEPCKDGYDKPAKRVLEFTTTKGISGLSTNASVCIINSEGNKSFIMFEDYNKTVMLFPKKRASEKTMKECHALASEKFADHLAAVKIQYNLEV